MSGLGFDMGVAMDLLQIGPWGRGWNKTCCVGRETATPWKSLAPFEVEGQQPVVLFSINWHASDGLGKIRVTTPLFIPYLPDVAALPLRVVGDDTSLVVACGAFSQDTIHVPCLLLPAPIARLMFKGCWHDALLLARWNLQLASATVSPANLWGEWPSMDVYLADNWKTRAGARFAPIFSHNVPQPGIRHPEMGFHVAAVVCR